jgi:hypothetical protein
LNAIRGATAVEYRRVSVNLDEVRKRICTLCRALQGRFRGRSMNYKMRIRDTQARFETVALAPARK